MTNFEKLAKMPGTPTQIAPAHTFISPESVDRIKKIFGAMNENAKFR